jgi:hypothetical protein
MDLSWHFENGSVRCVFKVNNQYNHARRKQAICCPAPESAYVCKTGEFITDHFLR